MIVIIDNYDSFTYNIYQYFQQLTDEPLEVYRNDKITVEELEERAPTRIVISPGPGMPQDAGISMEVIRAFVGRIPVLGVCLGMQAIAAVFGAKIVRAGRVVHGKAERMRFDGKGLFRTLDMTGDCMRYHSLSVREDTLPAELIVSARSDDGEIMGLRHARHVCEGVQFHPESIGTPRGMEMLRNFLHYRRHRFAYGALLEKAQRGTALSTDEAEQFMDELTDGNLGDARIAGLLVAINSKGIVEDEIVGCAQALRRKCAPALEGQSEGGRAVLGELAKFGKPAALGEGAKFGEPAKLGKPAALGEGAKLGKPAALGEGMKLGEPAKLGEQMPESQSDAHPPLLDTCGTGGDGIGTFNISSMSALVVASCGVQVAKHGNRAVSSRAGSAEFFQQLGIPIEISAAQATELLAKYNFCFLFAPRYHSALRFAAPARAALGVKTILNALGPLVNPARATHQLIGVFGAHLAMPMARAAHRLGVREVMVVRGDDGQDEISITGTTQVARIHSDGRAEEYAIDPRNYGLEPRPLAELVGGDAAENARLARELMSGAGRAAIRDAVILNAAAALSLCRAVTMEQAIALCRHALESGAVERTVRGIANLAATWS